MAALLASLNACVLRLPTCGVLPPLPVPCWGWLLLPLPLCSALSSAFKAEFSYSDARLTQFREVTRSRSLLLGTSALIQDFSLCKACHSAFKETPRLTCDQVVEDVHLEPCYHQLPSPECCLPLPSASPRARLPQLGWVQGWLPPSCSCTPCR